MFPFDHRSLAPSAQYKRWLVKKRPELKAERAKARLQWALAHKEWSAGDFQRVFYSDECIVKQEPAGQQRWVFSTPGQERWHVDCANPVKHRQVELMAWGCFWWSSSSASNRHRHRPRLPRPTASLAASGPRGRTGSPRKSTFPAG